MDVGDLNHKEEGQEIAEGTIVPLREMSNNLGFVLTAFCRRFFAPIRFSPSQEKDLQALAQKGHLVYVMESSSVLYYLFLNFWCLRLELPLAAYGNGIPWFFFFQPARKIIRMLRQRWSGPTREGKPEFKDLLPFFFRKWLIEQKSVVLFLRQPGRFSKNSYAESKSVLQALSVVQSRVEKPLFLVPLGILWGKRPEKMQRGVLDILVGDKESPGFLRQFFMLLRYSRHSVVTMGQVINLQEFNQANEHVEEELQQKKIRWTLHRELTLAKQHVAGPQHKPRKHILNSILSSRTLREHAREIARSEGKPFESVMKEAAKCADEIAADYNVTYVKFLAWILSWVWNNIYSGLTIDKEGIKSVREALRKGSVILLPSHKSHVDYLVLSYVFFNYDLPPPHIAAGVNLSFWPLGHIFRRAGAFFLRRTIRGQRLYGTVFKTYLKRLLKEAYVQEFFLEGTRSRTGKLMYPRLGLLSMELEAFTEGVSEDLHLVPISVSYEKVVEESSYTEESGGSSKQKEGLLGLLKTPRILRKKYGRVYIQFGRPISVRDYLQSRQLDLTKLDQARHWKVVEDLGLRTCHSINEIITVTPSSLTATVLLNHPERGITEADLLNEASFLFRLLEDLQVRISLSLQNLPWAIKESLGMFTADKVVQRWDDPEGTIYTLDESKRSPLNYYKNNILHFFLPFSFGSSVFRIYGSECVPERRFVEGLRVFVELFSREFIFPPVDPAGTYYRMIVEQLGDRRGYVSVDEHRNIRVENASRLEYMARFLSNYYESYYVFLRTAEQILGLGECEEKEFLKRVLDAADRYYRRGDLSRSESRSLFVFRNALSAMSALGCIQRVEKASGVRLSLEPAGKDRMSGFLELLSCLLSSSPPANE